MAKQNKRRNKRQSSEAPKDSKHIPLSQPSKQIKYRRYAIWLVSVIIVVVAGISAWAIYKNLSQNSSGSAGVTGAIASTGDSSNSVTGGPQINFPEIEYDFGKIAQGAKVSHTFVVKNTGNAPLQLIKAAGT